MSRPTGLLRLLRHLIPHPVHTYIRCKKENGLDILLISDILTLVDNCVLECGSLPSLFFF